MAQDIVKRMMSYVVEATILSGCGRREFVYTPTITFIPADVIKKQRILYREILSQATLNIFASFIYICTNVVMSSEAETDESKNENEKIKVVAASKKHSCSYVGCSFSFDRPWKLDRHLNTHTNQRPFKCDHPGCSKAYTNNSHLQRHKSVSHTEKKSPSENIPCPFPDCTKVFANKWSVKRHCKSHYSVGSHKCVVCGEAFRKYWELKYHIYAHWGLDPFVCEQCKESFKTRLELRRHQRRHKVYHCEHEGCQERFRSWNAVRSHMKSVHPDRYQCDFCRNYYKNKWTLTEHVLSHLPFDERDIIMCPYQDCERYYFYERNLEAHIRSYHHNLNHKCDIGDCEKTFTTKRRLQEHKKKHTEPKPIEKSPPKQKKSRRPRKDKGLPRKSMAAMLSGIILPERIDKILAQNNITADVAECIENVKAIISKETDSKENNGKVSKEEPCDNS